MIRFGLCCIFRNEPIKFFQTTARYTASLPEGERLQHLSRLCLKNAASLMEALRFCATHGIGDFRIKSQILPLKTHPEIGWSTKDLPGGEKMRSAFKACGEYSETHDIRTSFHPDQFVFLNSPSSAVHEAAVSELSYHAEVASWVGADVITIHAGGAYGNKKTALERLSFNILSLPKEIRRLLALENDDRIYTPGDLLGICSATGVRFVYDVHHHRCLPDGISEAETTARAVETWDREPLFHLSSPAGGREAKNPRPHSDYIDIEDFPCEWLEHDLTVEVEAKAKELAVIRLMNEIGGVT